ncbi:Pyridoxal 5'-phosphate synthase subunit snz1, partial [Coemansia aciculifera]
MAETDAEKRKRVKDEARKARIAARKAEAEKKAKEAAEKQKARDEQARLRWPVTRLLRSQLFRGAVIVNVTSLDQALLCQEVGVTAISAYDKSVQTTTVLRMSNPEAIKRYIDAVLIPVIANVRIGHFAEAKVMESIGVNMIDESDMLSTFTEMTYISRKREIGIPTICAVSSLKDCLLRIQEGALILRVKGTRDGGSVNEAFKVLNIIMNAIKGLRAPTPSNTELYSDASIYQPLLNDVISTGRLPVPLFGSGGIHTPSDVALMMEGGCDGVFVDTAVFLGLDPERHLKAIIQTTKDYKNVPKISTRREIAARKKEADKKDNERIDKEVKLQNRLKDKDSQSVTRAARVNMLKYGVIVEVANVIQAKLAQDAGFTAICPFNYPPTISNKTNGNPLTADPRVIRDMMNAVVIPVMTKVRVGHIVEALMAEKLGANIIDE